MSSDPQRNTDFISRLPAEIADNICSFLALPPRCDNIANLRLQSRFWNNVSTPFLLDEIRLIFRPDSFERLVAISQHRVIPHHVSSLLYEPNTLTDYPTREQWESTVFMDKDFLEDIPPIPGPDATDRDLRMYDRAIKKLRQRPKQTHSDSELDSAYLEYQKYLAQQQDLRDRDYGSEDIYQAMSKLAHLNNIRMNLGFAMGASSQYSRNAYNSALQYAGGDYDHPEPGVPQMKSLLLGAKKANLQLDSLGVGSVNWKFLLGSRKTFEQMMSTLAHLTELDLDIGCKSDDEDETSLEIPECRRFLEDSTRLHDFYAAAPNLKTLALTFDWYEPFSPADFKDVVQVTTWPFLRTVCFENIDTTDRDWVAFFNRHASTLKHVTFKTIRLMDGEWWEVLKDMRKGLQLSSAYVRGQLLGDDPPQCWLLEPDLWAEYSDMRSQGNRTSKAVQDYLMGAEGECPLLDDYAHPELYTDY